MSQIKAPIHSQSKCVSVCKISPEVGVDVKFMKVCTIILVTIMSRALKVLVLVTISMGTLFIENVIFLLLSTWSLTMALHACNLALRIRDHILKFKMYIMCGSLSQINHSNLTLKLHSSISRQSRVAEYLDHDLLIEKRSNQSFKYS